MRNASVAERVAQGAVVSLHGRELGLEAVGLKERCPAPPAGEREADEGRRVLRRAPAQAFRARKPGCRRHREDGLPEHLPDEERL